MSPSGGDRDSRLYLNEVIPAPAPDSTRPAFTDTDYRVLILDIDSGELTHVDTDRYAHPERSMNPAWSPDSRWIAYARRVGIHCGPAVSRETGRDLLASHAPLQHAVRADQPWGGGFETRTPSSPESGRSAASPVVPSVRSTRGRPK